MIGSEAVYRACPFPQSLTIYDGGRIRFPQMVAAIFMVMLQTSIQQRYDVEKTLDILHRNE